ncbi:phosphonate C-P lyase system protein PhnH [Methylobacterium sp. Leaf94]|uniref:phosphonate C-P lyase system protein PhnH n=1 Tax=Methylobacterium sp. Leaf94 TaxID=1736250 RepID=UPI000701F594|nr:phosphonate C-P lyase system protein PhnH [Methylobacterium sp. Leaf94]KQU25172.1 phosphonate C-P lyase system protein PhnH [Methylobacterium sp. Leaf94]
MAHRLAPGFADPVHEGQAVFRAAMEALSRPGRIRPLVTALAPPGPLTPELAALALALTDADTPVWLDAPLRADPAVAGFLRFHTGAPLVAAPAEAAFALIADPAHCPPFTNFAQGTPAYPDASATLILAVDTLSDEAGPGFTGPGFAGQVFAGPGIRGTARLDAGPLPAAWAARWAANHAGFPLGIDCLFVAPGRLAGLPRSTRPVAAEALPGSEALPCT